MSIFMVNKMEHNKIKVQSLTDKTISLKPKINKYILYDKESDSLKSHENF